jgi:hypothetical protein
VASGTNSTARQVGSALGIAVIGSLITTQTVSHAVHSIRGAALSTTVKAQAIAQVHAAGTGYRASPHLAPATAARLDSIATHSVSGGISDAFLFGFVIVLVGAGMALLLGRMTGTRAADLAEELDAFAPIEPPRDADAAPAAIH